MLSGKMASNTRAGKGMGPQLAPQRAGRTVGRAAAAAADPWIEKALSALDAGSANGASK
jgi:hypothetical protein